MQGSAANLFYIHSWFLVGDICTSNDRVCNVPLQTNLKPTHHLVARWQGQVRRCLKTIHAINLFAAKWLPVNCFTLTKDGLQTLNIPCLRAKSGSNCLDLLHWSYLKVSLSCGNSRSLSWILEMPLAPFLCHLPLVPWKTAHIFAANLCYIHSWFLIGSICTSNDRVCKVPLQIKLKPTHHLVGGWQGKSEGASKQFMPSICSLRNGFPSIALPWLRMACKL